MNDCEFCKDTGKIPSSFGRSWDCNQCDKSSEGPVACSMFDKWHIGRNEYGDEVDPDSCYVCGMYEDDH